MFLKHPPKYFLHLPPSAIIVLNIIHYFNFTPSVDTNTTLI